MVRDDGEQGLSYGSCLGEADVGPGVEDRQSLEYSTSGRAGSGEAMWPARTQGVPGWRPAGL